MDKIVRKQTMILGFFLWQSLDSLSVALLTRFKKLSHFSSFSTESSTPSERWDRAYVTSSPRFCRTNAGLQVATFLCGAESFPTPLRGHFLGFAAAVGKAGAAIGTEVSTPIQDSFNSDQKGVQGVFLIGAAFAVVGGIIAWIFIPDKNRDLESEDANFRVSLEEHGFTGFFGESIKEEIKTTSYKI
jgi:MFS family permease